MFAKNRVNFFGSFPDIRENVVAPFLLTHTPGIVLERVKASNTATGYSKQVDDRPLDKIAAYTSQLSEL